MDNEGVGCGCMLVGLGICVALIIWAAQGFPAILKVTL